MRGATRQENGRRMVGATAARVSECARRITYLFFKYLSKFEIKVSIGEKILPMYDLAIVKRRGVRYRTGLVKYRGKEL